MVAQSQTDRITVAEYERISEHLESIGFPVELEEGRLIKRVSTKAWRSEIVNTIIAFLKMHLITHHLPGIVTGETTGYQAADDDCPEPDAAYCALLVIAPDTPCIPEAPALVIEVVSDPGNKRELERPEAKRRKYLAMGATVWEVWAKPRDVHVYRPGQPVPMIERETLHFDGLPGLEIPLTVVFAKVGK
jgi:Uma2 family endonuclease